MVSFFHVRKSMKKHLHISSSKKFSSQGSIRIISGRWRGRKLPVPPLPGLRPTTDRVKETLFNWLAQQLPNACCLDVFAGSGGLGFEAASRYAKKVVLLEQDIVAFKLLQQTKNSLNSDVIPYSDGRIGLSIRLFSFFKCSI